jgi:hypothetical protein
MKRVRVIAAAVPAALGIAFPAAAQATAATHPPAGGPHRVHPAWGGTVGCLNIELDYSCFSVRGGVSNTVNNMKMYNWPYAGIAYVGYKDVAGHPAKSKWRDNPFSAIVGDRWQRKYGPDCSFPTGTWVYGWTSYHRPASQLMVEIYGSGFTGKHQCA